MSVPAIVSLICVSVVERVESYILNLVNFIYKSRYIPSTIIADDHKAVCPALYHRAGSISTGTYIYDLNFGHKMAWPLSTWNRASNPNRIFCNLLWSTQKKAIKMKSGYTYTLLAQATNSALRGFLVLNSRYHKAIGVSLIGKENAGFEYVNHES